MISNLEIAKYNSVNFLKRWTQMKKPVKNLFRIRLVQLREEANLTQKQFAEAVKISNSTINRYETGIREPDYDTLILFADFFKVSTDYLLGRTDKK